jgi:hypothetical protein
MLSLDFRDEVTTSRAFSGNSGIGYCRGAHGGPNGLVDDSRTEAQYCCTPRVERDRVVL